MDLIEYNNIYIIIQVYDIDILIAIAVSEVWKMFKGGGSLTCMKT